MQLIDWTKRLGMDTRFQERYLNEGFSGGEKKRNEILQMAMLEPDVAVLDETDSGLDIDALRQVAAGIDEVRNERARARHPAHHALPAHPRAPRAPTSCTCSSTAASSRPATPSSPDGRGRRLRRVPHAARRKRRVVSAARRRHDQARLPAPRTRGQRQARSSYLDSASSAQKPRRGARRDGPLLPPLLRQHPPRRVHDRRGGDRRVRGRPPQGRRASSTRLRSRRDRVHPQRDRGDQPRRVHVGARQPARRRRDRAHRTWSTTPTSCRGTCSPPSAASSCAGSR